MIAARSSTVRQLFLLIIVVLLSAAVSACSCMPPGSPEAELNSSDAVFAGEVQQITDSSTSGFMSSGQDKDVAFAVSEVWKGPDHETLIMKTAESSAACGYPFKEGEEYLVYAHTAEHKSGDDLTVSLCSRTARLEDAQQDLDALNGGEAPATPGKNKEPQPTNNMLIVVMIGLMLLVFSVLTIHRYRRGDAYSMHDKDLMELTVRP